MRDIHTFLADNGITYSKTEHPAVFTCEEAERLVPSLPGIRTKNLFLRDGKAKRFFLVVVDDHTAVDLKELRKILHADKLSFGSPEKLKELLGVEPGAATVLGLIADEKAIVEVIFDRKIWSAAAVQCHPLMNTATLVISHDGIEAFLKATRHEATVIDVPAKSE